ncbi:aldehyde dehydrogenase family protein [symbiont of Argiope bruennichi]|uniref:aldehyde dehydrogenase family protein n=1 Tax=symbiont of Argiope bruennichi TaxID=2810479 RepID=UPI003DA5CEBE
MHNIEDFFSEFKKQYQTTSPYSNINQKVLTFELPFADKDYIEKVFLLAKEKFKTWKMTNTSVLVHKMKQFIKELQFNQDKIIYYCHLEAGKSLKDAETEFLRTIEYIETSINIFQNFQDNCFNMDERMAVFSRQPLGVVLAISPFNYPINLLVSKIVPALLMKNCLVIKPASSGTLTATYIFLSLLNAGFERGVVNLVPGKGKEISDLLIKNENINLINFTGSTQVGKYIAKSTYFSQLIMELGGNDPAIVLDDADQKNAVKEILNGAFSYNGQRCTAIKRVYVHENIFEEFSKLLISEFKNLITFSSNIDENSKVTPLISDAAVENAMNLLSESFKKMNPNDFEVFSLNNQITGQKVANMIGKENLFFKEKDTNLIFPTIILIHNSNYDTLIEKEEQFAPILPVIKVKSLKEMIKLANSTDYGLQASVFTKNINIINQCFQEIECGTLNINQQTKRSPDIFPFQGIKSSGISQQGIYQSLINNSTIKGLVIKK